MLKTHLTTLLLAGLAIILIGGGVVYSGIINVAPDTQYFVKNSLDRQPGQNAHLEHLNSYASPVCFFGCFDSLRSPFGPAFGCYSRWSLRLVLPASPTFFNDLLALWGSDGFG